MRSMSIKLTEEQHEQLRLAALVESRSMADIVRECVQEYTATRVTKVDLVKRAISEARSRGPLPLDRALKMASQAAEFDDTEGLGEIRVSRGKPVAARRGSKGTHQA